MSKRPAIISKTLREVVKLHSTSPRKQWERIDCFKKVHSGYWAENGRICGNFHFLLFLKKNWARQSPVFNRKMSTGLRVCNRGVRVWSGRFQTFSENFRSDCEICILRKFSGCIFSRQDFFHQNSFKNLRKNLQTFNRFFAWLTKLHPICPEGQFEWFF